MGVGINAQPVERLLMSRKEAAESLGISLRSVAYLIAQGTLRSRKIGGRTLIETQELRRFAAVGFTGSLTP